MKLPGRAAAALVVLGAVLRLATLFFLGMDDTPHYFAWGMKANAEGLALAYHGIYFPFQWQIFQICAALCVGLGLPHFVVFKGLTLLCDVGILCALARLLDDLGMDPWHSLWFWCHPSFLIFDALGYVDAQFTLAVLATILLVRRGDTSADLVLAGIPFGLAFLMKPQVQVLMLAAGSYVVFRGYGRRDWKPAGLLIVPSLLFGAYSVAFALEGRSIWALVLSYLDIASVMPALSANMLNMWYPIAFLSAPERPIYFVGDTTTVLGALTIGGLAMIATAGTIVAFSGWLLRREHRGSRFDDWSLLFLHAATVLPMMMTNAHENHFFLAGVLLVLLLPFVRSALVKMAIHLLWAIPLLNLVSLYGLGDNALSRLIAPLAAARTGARMSLLACVAVAAFLVVAGAVADVGSLPRRSRAPQLLIGALIAGLALVALRQMGLA